ncbi:MAG: UPF0175 family protein [Candidatus Hydrothermarchaeales archaeon]
MGDFISFRSKKELKELADLLAGLESRNLSDTYRDIFRVGIEEKRKRVALDKYSKGEVSLGRAAEIAGVSLWEMLELLRDRKVDLNIDADEILEAAGEI